MPLPLLTLPVIKISSHFVILVNCEEHNYEIQCIQRGDYTNLSIAAGIG
jgi:hypothetical protein